METYELTARYDARKSFYGKAKIVENNNILTLFSYGTKVAEIDTAKNTAKIFNAQSQTTLRHIKEFFNQSGFRADNKQQMLNDYWAD